MSLKFLVSHIYALPVNENARWFNKALAVLMADQKKKGFSGVNVALLTYIYFFAYRALLHVVF